MPYRRSYVKPRYPTRKTYARKAYKRPHAKGTYVKRRVQVKSKATGWIQAERKKYRVLSDQKKAQSQAVRVNASIAKLQ